MSKDELTRRQFLAGTAATAAAVVLGSVVGAEPGAASIASAAMRSRSSLPKRGGELRVAMEGGGTAETLDPDLYNVEIDWARGAALFDQLTRLLPDKSVGMELATSLEPNHDGSQWVVKLREGVTWHDGKPFTADDVIYTIQHVANPKVVSSVKPYVAPIDAKNLKASGPLTLIVPMSTPYGDLASLLATASFKIVRSGENFKSPIGTGPFKFKSFVPGTSSVFERYDSYWASPEPYVDQLEIVSIPDQLARVNALLDGSVDAVQTLTFQQLKQYAQGGAIVPLVAKDSPYTVPLTMDCTRAPFTDVRVRQAMRLVVDRPQMITVAQDGFGIVANDLYGIGLPYYADFPQRHQDLDQAKFLLRKAGQQDLRVTLDTTTLIPGMLESAEVLVQQAAGAGIRIQLRNVPSSSFFSSVYLKVPFCQSWWTNTTIPQWMLSTVVTNCAYPETNFATPAFSKMVYSALAEVNAERAKTMWGDVQKVLFDDGGYIFWGTQPIIDGLSRHVRGAVASPWDSLSNYAFREWWLA